jgi:hypothetical protein
VPVLYFAAALIALVNHFARGFPPDPPYLEFTLMLLGAVGAWLLWKNPSPQSPLPAHHPAHESPADKTSAGKETGTNGFWQKERWAQLVALSAILSLAAGLGWWSTEVFYARQVIYSYDTQVTAAAQK